VQAVEGGRLKQLEAASQLGMSARQVRRLLARFRLEGPKGLVSKRRGHPSNHQCPTAILDRACQLIHQHYPDFGPTLACEKLYQNHQIKLSKETVRMLMINLGLWQAKQRKKAKVHQRRQRRSCRGELIQADASEHAWFEHRGPKCSLVLFIDDATPEIFARFFPASNKISKISG